MGYWKTRLLEEAQRGWASSDKSVCIEYIEDPALQSIVFADIDVASVCDFCHKPHAAPLDTLIGGFMNGIKNEFELAIDSVPWESRGSGFLINLQWDTYELLWDYSYVFASEELMEAVGECIYDDTWVEKDWVTRRRDEVLMDTWSRFCEAVKHKTRYVVWLLPDVKDIGAGEIQLSRVLDNVAKLLKELGLFKNFAAGQLFWRAQHHSQAKIEHTAARLGTVPPERARHDNRMSPAGIPLFYGTLTAKTAIKEVDSGEYGTYTTCAAFKTVTEMKIVDFTDLPEIPSMFDPDRGHRRREIEFLHEFVEELSKPVDPEDAQIEYVPTQIVTEFLLHAFGVDEKQRTSGLIYRSSVADGDCVALNIPNERCFDAYECDNRSEPALLLMKESIRTTPSCAADVGG